MLLYDVNNVHFMKNQILKILVSFKFPVSFFIDQSLQNEKSRKQKKKNTLENSCKMPLQVPSPGFVRLL